MEPSKDSKGSEFHVLLSGMKLPARLENKIAAQIQSVVSSALAGYPNPDDPDGDDGPAGGGGGGGPFPGGGGPYAVIPSIRWKGYWIKALGKDFRINPAEIDAQQRHLQKGIQGF
ncbi:hypothetical protein HNV11_17610 [Spirosoma taeanense]|uniref:Uncharacterized protein n=1 Tax=Spirosoma taeanense TaxID=2735870 RepID=A0A6M5YCV2_9BACT|nr:hypothetical protein [Spirosoma taeanense]QJW91061.1 hypothetical protein HNV11_17610 [Spirosoma taeanense]